MIGNGRKYACLVWPVLVMVLLSACSAQLGVEANPGENPTVENFPSSTPGEQSTEIPSAQETEREPAKTRKDVPLLPDEGPPSSSAAREFKTDFSIHSVPYDEILSGGPPKDGIPAIDNPQFISVEQADEWLVDAEPVLLFQEGGVSRAYPLQILTYHEIVNDEIASRPVTITYCPLCNTGIAFDRRVEGQVLDFGTTGRLRYSNLIMYDRQTETWWQQATGEAIAGELTGTQLQFLPSPIVSWEDFKANHPDGQVLSRETGYSRPYGNNPYLRYDDENRSPFLYVGPPTPDRMPAMSRVLALELGDEVIAYPYQTLQEIRIVNDRVGQTDVVVLWTPGTASALDDQTIAGGRDVGSAAAFERRVAEHTLTFRWKGSKIIDEETGSEWNGLGIALAGELEGEQLRPLPAVDHFWFSWVAFKPNTTIYTPDS